MAFFTRLNSSLTLLAPTYDDNNEDALLDKNDDTVLATNTNCTDASKIGADANDKPVRLTSAQFAELRLAQLRSHEVRNLTLAELERLQHLTSDASCRRLTLAELQKLQQQAPLVDSRHTQLLRSRPPADAFRKQETPVTAVEIATTVVHQEVDVAKRKMDFDFDLELGVQV